MHAVHGLRLDGGIPPWVQQKNIIRRVQRDAGPRRLQRNQHRRRPGRGLELLHRFRAIDRHARQLVARQIGELGRERRPHALEQHHELGENHDLVPAAHDLRELFHQQVDLSGIAQRRLHPRQHVGIAARLPQARQQREKAKRLFPHRRPDVVPEPVQTLRTDSGVFRPLHVGERADQIDLHFLRQLFCDFIFRAAQNERCQLRPQAGQCALPVRDQRRLKRGSRTEQSGQQETKDTPEIELPVFQRRAREHDPVFGAHGETGLRDLRVGVFDELPFIKDGIAEIHPGQQRPVFSELGVARDPDIHRRLIRKVVPGLQHIDGECGEEFRGLFSPDRHDARGTHNQVRQTRCRPGGQQRQHLERFPQPHFVRQ